ncbi:MAG: DUF1326 domain-containing protein [Thermodesulfobacteriota bacterium]
MGYHVEGRLLEVCTCNTLCPCWVGEDPDLGYCDGLLGWHVDKGNIEGLDVSGRAIIMLCHIPGNILKGNWSVRVYVDQNATEKQKEELLKVWSGKLGGPIADMAKLVGEIVSVEKVPITFDIKGASGTVKVGDNIEAKLSPFKGATGKDTALYDTIFTTIPGSPAHVGKASYYRVKVPGFDIDLKGHNAVSGSFRFEA